MARNPQRFNEKDTRTARREYGLDKDMNGYDRFEANRSSAARSDYGRNDYSSNRDSYSRETNRTARDENRGMGEDYYYTPPTNNNNRRASTEYFDFDREYDYTRNRNQDQNQNESSGFFGKGPKGWKRSDERIREDICEALSDHNRIDASDIDVSVKNGDVTLSGTVDRRDIKREAEWCAERVRGVTDVHNQLRVKQGENVTEMRKTGSLS